MIEVRGFNGKLNLDDNPYRVPKDDFLDALNVTRDAQGVGQDMTITNVIGNTLVSDNLPDGTNKVIGNYADRTRNRQYYFTWNSLGYHRISYYNASLDTIVVLMENLTDTADVDVLKFNPSYRINHIDVVYRDELGDLLFWTDGLNPPRKINIKTAQDGGYGVIIESYIDVAKQPPLAPPYCAYIDEVVTVNNLNNKLFKFKYRFVFDDNEKSVTSAQSQLAIPTGYSLQSISSDPTKNSAIFMVLQTGDKNVTKIEVLGAESLGETWSDFFLIEVLDKDRLNINNNDVTTYKFFNNNTYTYIPLNESIQPFDNIPLIAETQSLPNGNVLDYGAITEGYDLVNGIQEVTNITNRFPQPNQPLIVAYQHGQAAFGSGEIKIIATNPPVISGHTQTCYVNIRVGTSSNYQLVGTTPNVLSQMYSNAIALGFTASLSNNELIVSRPNQTIYYPYPNTVISNLPNTSVRTDSQLAYDWSSRYSYGVVYFDEKGRTNGVVSTPDSSFITANYNELLSVAPYIPCQQFEIKNRPPLWASYFEIVRTKNLTKSNFLYWISERTFKDSVPNQAGYKYAYISINTLTQYIIDNPEAKTLGYEFTSGDRVRFVKLYDSSALANTSHIYTDKDYEILNSVTNPTVNGVVIKGQVLKINLPPTNNDFDFGGNDFANYLIEIYTPAQNFSNETNLYYEFGQKYSIGNPGTINAFHQGMIQNQTPSLSNYALYEFFKGDSYFRYRTFSRGGTTEWNINSRTINASNAAWDSTLALNTSNSTDYVPQATTSAIVNGVFNAQNYPLIIVNTTTPPSFRIKGTITVKSSRNSSSGSISTLEKQSSNPYGIPYPQPTTLCLLGNLTAGIEKTIVIDRVYSVPVGYDWITWAVSSFWGEITSFNLTFTDARTITQGIVDPNFSENYDSAASPNGRAWIFDPNAGQNYNPVQIRFGGEYQQGTNINNLNRFYEEDYDIYDRSRGAIRKMFIEGRNQYIFQEFDVGVVTVLTQIVRDTAANPLSAESSKLLNKVVYPYIGQFGIGDVPESFAYGKHAKYFVDSNKGVVCRLSTDGVTPLSILYKTNAFFVPKLAGFKDSLNITIPATGTPTVYGAFDAFTNKYVIAMDAIDRPALQQPAYTLIYTESRGPSEGFETFMSYHPENMGDLNNLLMTFKDGQLWKHNSSTYCNFYGIQYDCYVETVFNDSSIDKKSYLAIMQTSNAAWYCPTIKSQLNSYGSTPQETEIVEARFALLEGQYNSAILRDMNSPGGIISGDTIHGNYLIVKFKRDAAGNLYYINTVSLNYNNSPLNVR